jgi:hypothetical protein
MCKETFMGFKWGVVFGLLVWLLLGLCWKALAQEPINIEKLVDSIYVAEGGKNAKVPFGILSVRCEGYKECRSVCRNTVRNNIVRWNKAGRPSDFISYLGGKYCPVSCSPLNKNWIKNVRRIYGASPVLR